VRSGPDQRLPLGEPKDADVEKAANRRSEQENPEKQHAVHTSLTFSPCRLTAPVPSRTQIRPCRLAAAPPGTRKI